MPAFLPGESHGQRSLVGYSLWGCKESDTNKQLSADTHIWTPYRNLQGFSMTQQFRIHLQFRRCGLPGSGKSPGGGHGDPLQYSCLENLMDRGRWEATVHEVTKSQTGLTTAHKNLNPKSSNLSTFYNLVLFYIKLDIEKGPNL